MRKKVLAGQINMLLAENKKLFDKANNAQLTADDYKAKYELAQIEKEALLKTVEELTKKSSELEEKIQTLELKEQQKESVTIEDFSPIEEVSVEIKEEVERQEVKEEKGTEDDLDFSKIADSLDKISVNDNVAYAAAVIGEVVVSSTELCNYFVSTNNNNAKDLINLAVGRVEMFKNQTMKLLDEEDSKENFKLRLQILVNEINDYFSSLKAQ